MLSLILDETTQNQPLLKSFVTTRTQYQAILWIAFFSFWRDLGGLVLLRALDYFITWRIPLQKAATLNHIFHHQARRFL